MTAFDVARIGPGEGSVAPRTRLRSDAPSQSLDGAWRFRIRIHELNRRSCAARESPGARTQAG